MISLEHKKVCRVLNYIDDLLIVISTNTGYVSISAFASLIGVAIGLIRSADGVEICAITAEIKKYKSVFKKKKKKHDKIFSKIFFSKYF